MWGSNTRILHDMPENIHVKSSAEPTCVDPPQMEQGFNDDVDDISIDPSFSMSATCVNKVIYARSKLLQSFIVQQYLLLMKYMDELKKMATSAHSTHTPQDEWLS